MPGEGVQSRELGVRTFLKRNPVERVRRQRRVEEVRDAIRAFAHPEIHVGFIQGSLESALGAVGSTGVPLHAFLVDLVGES